MRKILAALVGVISIIALVNCGGSTNKTNNGGEESAEFKAVKSTLLGSCGSGGCHDGVAQNPTLLKESHYITNKTKIQESINIADTNDPAFMPSGENWGGASGSAITAAKAYLNGL
mgnify:CR=1 FL=1